MSQLSTIAVFADCGLTTHQAQYRHVGEAVARRKARMICIANQGEWPRTLVESALAHGGKVSVIAAGDDVVDVPRGVRVEHVPDCRSAGRTAAQMSQAIMGLPGGIGSTAALYNAWVDCGGAKSGKPVGLLNRRQAFEVVRGFLTDVAAVGLGGNVDQLVQVSDTFEDLWMRISRLVE